MAGAQGSALAVAVCNAGGLGALPCAMRAGRDAARAGAPRGELSLRFAGAALVGAGEAILVSQIVGAMKVPVIAAGGIADAAGVAAVLALGAAAAMVGTAYLLCPEATTSAVHRAALSGDAGGRETALTNLFSGRPARGIVNRLMRELGPLSGAAPAFPLAATAVAPLRAAAERRGSGDFSPLWAGESDVQMREVPAAELTRALASAL